jgi:HTH-type transcriptional regulator/antitoxin HigA
MDPPDPIEAIRFRLEQQGLDTRALVGVIGGRSRVYEVMHRKRPLTLEMIRRLHERFGIPPEALIRPVRVKRRRAA